MPTGNRLSFVSTIIPNLSLYELFRKVTTLFSYLQEFSRKVTEKVVDSLYLLQFACFIFMLVNAFFGGAEKKKPLQQLSEERRNFIQNSLDQWCMDLGYKDCNVNMLTLSRTLCISKNELSLFFDQYLHSNFRIWLSEIRLNAAKKMMLECPDYSNDIISAECGFSCRTHLYRIFKTKEGCSPTEWRDFQSTDAAQNDSN